MTKMAGKHSFAKSAIIWGFVGLLALAVTVDFLWAASSSSAVAYVSIASALSHSKSHVIVVQNTSNAGYNKKKEDNEENPKVKVAARLLSATFADLPAPKMEWEQMPTAPVPRLDGSSIQINNLFYIFSGFGSLDYVHSHVDVYNFTDNTWSDRFDTPKEMANSHLGIASDGRYIYVVTGQYGPQCRGPVARTFAVDTVTRKWSSMPPLPAPRYAPATQIWRGRLHVMGGSKENRHTPAVDHWSIAVKNGKALEKEWQVEVPVPRGGPHRNLFGLHYFECVAMLVLLCAVWLNQ